MAAVQSQRKKTQTSLSLSACFSLHVNHPGLWSLSVDWLMEEKSLRFIYTSFVTFTRECTLVKSLHLCSEEVRVALGPLRQSAWLGKSFDSPSQGHNTKTIFSWNLAQQSPGLSSKSDEDVYHSVWQTSRIRYDLQKRFIQKHILMLVQIGHGVKIAWRRTTEEVVRWVCMTVKRKGRWHWIPVAASSDAFLLWQKKTNPRRVLTRIPVSPGYKEGTVSRPVFVLHHDDGMNFL